MTEAEFLTALRTLPLHPGAHGLRDDTATLGGFTVTTDTLVEGVHFLASDPPGDVAWKLLAVNLSDLAAKGATPVAVLLNYPLGDDAWDAGFLAGLDAALRRFACPLLGGDTVSQPPSGVRPPARVLTLTAFGSGGGTVPRTGARAGDGLWVAGPIGDAGAGLRIARGAPGPAELLAAYRRPQPRLTEGRALAAQAHAMMDVSDGLLIDAQRMAAASGLAVALDLAAVPLSAALVGWRGDDRAARLDAATAGDDYALLFALPDGLVPAVAATRVGHFTAGSGLTVHDAGEPVALPASLGWQHGLRGRTAGV